MKRAPNIPVSSGVSLPDAEEIIRRQRKAHGKPTWSKPRAVDLVLNNEQVIRQLRDAGYKQEDAVLLLFELGGENHKPDTLRKAIARILGPWNSPVDHAAEANDMPEAEGDNTSDAELADHETGAVQPLYDNYADEGDLI